MIAGFNYIQQIAPQVSSVKSCKYVSGPADSSVMGLSVSNADLNSSDANFKSSLRKVSVVSTSSGGSRPADRQHSHADEKGFSKRSEEMDLDPGVLRFLVLMSLKPALHALRDALAGKIDKKKWDFGHCPLCGSEPAMAYFEKTGKRMLQCGLCGEEWGYPRLSCPFCRNAS